MFSLPDKVKIILEYLIDGGTIIRNNFQYGLDEENNLYGKFEHMNMEIPIEISFKQFLTLCDGMSEEEIEKYYQKIRSSNKGEEYD